jgi:hypothetical protein
MKLAEFPIRARTHAEVEDVTVRHIAAIDDGDVWLVPLSMQQSLSR